MHSVSFASVSFYDSVAVKEVADAIYQQTGRQIPEADITVPDIKAVGTYECSARLHPDVVASFSVVIQRDKQITIKTTPAKK
jgi:large subunit ribosomal protein L9